MPLSRRERFAKFRVPLEPDESRMADEKARKKRLPCPDGERICVVKECLNIAAMGVNACSEHEEMFNRVRHHVAGGTPRSSKATSWVYFVRVGEDGPIKIGSSVEPAARISSLQTGMPDKLFLLGVCPGGRAKERELHALFADFRRRGEWFAPAGEILDYIKSNAKPLVE